MIDSWWFRKCQTIKAPLNFFFFVLCSIINEVYSLTFMWCGVKFKLDSILMLLLNNIYVQELSFHHVPQAMMPPPYMYEMAYRRESKGTGVFIPRSSAPRRKNRSGRSNSINNGSQRQLNNPGLAVSWAANNDTLQSNYYKDSGSLKNRTWLRFTKIFDSY